VTWQKNRDVIFRGKLENQYSNKLDPFIFWVGLLDKLGLEGWSNSQSNILSAESVHEHVMLFNFL